MIRLAGILLIMGTALWFGAYFAAKERYRLKELEELERGILLLKSQIQYLSAPLPEVLEGISWKTDGVIGESFQEAAERMAKRDGATAEEIWQEVWKKQAVHTFFTKDDLDAVLLFGRTLGYLDKEQQGGSIQLLLRYIANALEQGKKRLEKNGRLYYGMGALGGLLIVVTLL